MGGWIEVLTDAPSKVTSLILDACAGCIVDLVTPSGAASLSVAVLSVSHRLSSALLLR